MTDTLPTVGFVGLGSMGSGMTRNLQAAGFPLVVTDLRPESAAELVSAGARWADTAGEVAANSDLVITMLPTPRHVADALHGAGGILSGIADGGTWIDMSTSVPEVADAVRSEHTDRGLHILDAPVSGMSVGAANGMLQIFIGGDAADVERLLPVFHAMGDPDRVMHVGGHGAGYAVKLMINQLWFSHLIATAEVLSVGVKAGVDLDVLRRRTATSSRTTCCRSLTVAIMTKVSRSCWPARTSASRWTSPAQSACPSSSRHWSSSSSVARRRCTETAPAR